MKNKNNDYTLTVKPGDVLTFQGIYYHVPGWMDDQPVVFTKPFLHYTEGNWEYELENICIELCVDGEFQFDNKSIVEDDIQWSGKSSKSIKRAINKALKTNEKPYKSVWNEVFECDVRFYEAPMEPDKPVDEEENPMEMKFEIIRQKTI